MSKRFLAILLLAMTMFIANSCGVLKRGSNGSEEDRLRAELVSYAKKHIGCKYKYGAAGPHRFDCSGFTSYVYKHSGITIARSSRDQAKEGVSVRKGALKPGDLVFFARKGRIFHVGMVTDADRDGFHFIHASSKGVMISSSEDSYWKSKYHSARRIVKD